MPPSVIELENRLIKRATESPEKIKIRIEKAKEELKLADQFDTVVVNHQLDQAKNTTVQIITSFLKGSN
jgi:guanylate kinase